MKANNKTPFTAALETMAPRASCAARDARKRTKLLIAGAAVLALLAITAGGVLAYYLNKTGGYELVTAQEFFFAGDMLSEEQPSYYLNAGTGSVDITLRNHPDALRFSQGDIAYTVTVTEKESGSAVFNGSGTLEKNRISDDTVTVSGLESGKSYIVSATGTSGYSKTISAEFSVLSETGSAYKHLASPDGASVVLTVWADYTCGTVEIGFPAGLIPDSSDPALAGVHNYSADTYSAGTVSDTFAGGYYSKTYRFFLSDGTSNYSADDFTVTVGGVTAQTSALPQ